MEQLKDRVDALVEVLEVLQGNALNAPPSLHQLAEFIEIARMANRMFPDLEIPTDFELNPVTASDLLMYLKRIGTTIARRMVESMPDTFWRR